VKRLIYVEDKYGIEFHSKLLEKLREKGIIGSSPTPRIERKPVEKCNAAVRRKVLARAVEGPVKALFVIDAEGERNAEEFFVLRHLKKLPPHVQVRVAAVEPRHEAWLCVGLGGDKPSCRRNPELELCRLRGVVEYRKEYLGEWADRLDVTKLLDEPDFKRYLDHLRWIMEEP
jgi:hypothetical protein